MGNKFHRGRDASAVTAALTTIGQRWKLLIVSRLLENPLTLSALCSTIPNAPAAELVQQAKELIADDIVCVDGERGYWEVYSVTDYGRTLVPAIERMGRWGRRHLARFE